MPRRESPDWQNAVKNIARELRIELVEAETWCERWEQFAERRGMPRDDYFWDSGRGWIDAQRSFDGTDRPPEGSRRPESRMRLAPPIALRGWIDAQRSFENDQSSERSRLPESRMRLAPPIAVARRVDPGSRGRNVVQPGLRAGSAGSGVDGRKGPAGPVADVGNR
jgi:hypothetical protein